MFFNYQYYYYIVIATQAICVLHSIKNGTQSKWLWVIMFLPFVGCLVYLYSEFISKKSNYKVYSNKPSTNFFPSNRIKQLEENLKFSNTFNNKVALADEYLFVGETAKAVDLYNQCLTGNFANHDYVYMQLILAYSEQKKYEEVVIVAKKVSTTPQFIRSRYHTLYAIALGLTGNIEAAEKEFKSLNGKFSNFESRYYYGVFLKNQNRIEDARKIFNDIVGEANHLNAAEKRAMRNWLDLSRAELPKN